MAEPVDPRPLLAGFGISGIQSIAPVGGGLSGTRVYRVVRTTGDDLLLRVFPPESWDWVQREVAAQQAASEAGLPVPAVLHAGPIGDPPVPAIVALWARGRTLIEEFEAGPPVDPALAHHLGDRSGAVLARIHAVPPPPRLLDDPEALHRRWLPDLPIWLVNAVASPNTSACLLHFDFHPGNLLFDDGDLAAVIDWTNAIVGDPRLDLGRTYACLQFGARRNPAMNAHADQFWRGLVAGYGQPTLTLEDLAPFFAVGLTTLIDDQRRLAIDGALDDALAELEVERDAWLGMIERNR